ncbi:MAG: GTPase ObgE [Candidatus Aminicenantes bacterium]|nr:GTPase ObgE [Candidatus Aminicenantes bacterium]
MFIDQVRVNLKAGRGGDGAVSFRREKGVPKGGPDGGHGGHGGSVLLVAETGLTTLAYFRFHPVNRAKNGDPGQGARKHGKRGADLELCVPVGTIVKDAATGRVLCDLIEPGQGYVAAKGGKGGRGNISFATAVHQAPREHEPGRPGEDQDLILELKMIADVGLIGFPNVGKSTLISNISAARPVIADYPFTTLIPNLGVVDVAGLRSFIVADVPGLIAGAHQGQGLGIQFLKHVERTRVLVHILDVSPYSGRDPVDDYRVVRCEIAAFNPKLAARPQVIAANKVDLLRDEDAGRLKAVKKLAASERCPFFAVSAMKGEGLKKLVAALDEAVLRLKEGKAAFPKRRTEDG